MMKTIKSAKEIQEVIFINNLKALHITFSLWYILFHLLTLFTLRIHCVHSCEKEYMYSEMQLPYSLSSRNSI